MKRSIVTTLILFCSWSFGLDIGCGPDLVVQEAVEQWARSGADLERADLYEISTLETQVRIPFLFPKVSALRSERFRDLLKSSKNVFWRSGRDIRVENGIVALSENGTFESNFDFAEGSDVVEGIQKGFDREFRMAPNGIARPIVQIVYPPSLELSETSRDLVKKQTRLATAIRIEKSDPVAVIVWGSEYLPAGISGAVLMFDTLVSIPHTMTLREHLSPLEKLELNGGTVFPTIETSFILRETGR